MHPSGPHAAHGPSRRQHSCCQLLRRPRQRRGRHVLSNVQRICLDKSGSAIALRHQGGHAHRPYAHVGSALAFLLHGAVAMRQRGVLECPRRASDRRGRRHQPGWQRTFELRGSLVGMRLPRHADYAGKADPSAPGGLIGPRRAVRPRAPRRPCGRAHSLAGKGRLQGRERQRAPRRARSVPGQRIRPAAK